MEILRPILFIIVLIATLYAFSINRKGISWRFVAAGVILQFFLALLFLKIPVVFGLFQFANDVVGVLEKVTLQATQFLFGYLAGGKTPFDLAHPENNFIVAFRVLPLILFMSALSALLFHWKIIPTIIKLISRGLQNIFKISGPLGFGAASSFFFGTIEAPLLVRPYLKKMDDSELLALISCTMATIAGTVMVLYASVLGNIVNEPMTHMMTASLLSIPAALTLSHLISPTAVTQDTQKLEIENPHKSSMEAIVSGTSDGLTMLLQITAIIIVLFAFMYLINEGLNLISSGLKIEHIVGQILKPLMWLLGISWEESHKAGELMAIKIILNEFVAYTQLTTSQLSQRTVEILTYAMCGFANFASAGIVIGGLSTILPERRKDLGPLTLKAVVIGNAATMMTAAIYAILQ